MKDIVRFAGFWVATSVFTAFCAMGLCVATERFVLSAMPPLFSGLHMVIFGSTLAVYNLPRLIPKPYDKERTPTPLKNWYYFFFLSGFVLLIAGLPSLSVDALVASGVSGIVAISYFTPTLPFGTKKRLRDYGTLKIIVLTGVWTVATAILPMLCWHINILDFPFEIIIRYIFVFALCVLFDIRDMQTDIRNNIATLPHRVGVEYAYRLVHFSMLLFFMISTMQYIRHPEAGRLTSAALTAVVTIAVALFVRRNPGHKAFVAMTDGMMLLYALLVIMPWA